jgi:hypothetical protein
MSGTSQVHTIVAVATEEVATASEVKKVSSVIDVVG